MRDIFYRAAHPYTQALLECDPAREDGKSRYLPVIPGDIPDLHNPPKGCVFANRCVHAGDLCRSTTPTAVALDGAGHLARCHLLDGSVERVVQAAAGPVEQAKTKVFDADDTTLLEVDKLSVRFSIMGPLRAKLSGVKEPYVDAVLDASLTVRRGETLGLVGESGSGKTTLGRAILGLAPALSGRALFNGQDVLTLSPSAFKPLRRNMAMMFQDPVGSLSPRRTVQSLITEPLDIHGCGRQEPRGRGGAPVRYGAAAAAISCRVTRMNCQAGKHGASVWHVRLR